MRKKKNPEQEEQPGIEEQEVDNPTQEPEEPEQPQEEPAQDQEPEDQEEPEAEEPAEEEPAEDPQEPQEDHPEDPAPAEPQTDEVATLRRQLMEAQGRNAAYAAGVAPGMVDDAVTLAMAEAAKSGTVTEATVARAMEAVLSRHPEWKADAGSKQKSGGFKVGADRDSGGAYKKPAGSTPQNTKRWNRFK